MELNGSVKLVENVAMKKKHCKKFNLLLFKIAFGMLADLWKNGQSQFELKANTETVEMW